MGLRGDGSRQIACLGWANFTLSRKLLYGISPKASPVQRSDFTGGLTLAEPGWGTRHVSTAARHLPYRSCSETTASRLSLRLERWAAVNIDPRAGTMGAKAMKPILGATSS